MTDRSSDSTTADEAVPGARERRVPGARVGDGITSPVEVAVTDAGPESGPAVLLLHGFPDSRRLWRHQVRALADAGHRVVAPDLRGFGDTDAPDRVGAYRLGLVVDDVLAVLDALGLDRVVVVGHDWGSLVAWRLAAAHPERVRALVAVSVGHPGARAAGGPAQLWRGLYVLAFLVPGLAERLLPWRGWWLWRALAWRGARPADEPDLARQVADLSRPGRLAAGLAWYRANATPGRRRRRAGSAAVGAQGPGVRRGVVDRPVMGVWSDRDPALTERQMTASARFVTGPWRYETLVGVDHWVPVRAPSALDALLLGFLEQLEA
ncbi:alpha/beta fold hydrolase [Aquipuribacter sp. SD81]|uniref:alpha/beta fold hydrolase n=1 Tax=Aquipuribacter sp. SD81 TaxID=3127703 RepID=UPI003017E9BB